MRSVFTHSPYGTVPPGSSSDARGEEGGREGEKKREGERRERSPVNSLLHSLLHPLLHRAPASIREEWKGREGERLKGGKGEGEDTPPFLHVLPVIHMLFFPPGQGEVNKKKKRILLRE